MKLRTAVLFLAVSAAATFGSLGQPVKPVASKTAPVVTKAPPREHKSAPTKALLTSGMSIVAQKPLPWHNVYIFAPAKSAQNTKVERLGNMSSLAWTTIAANPPGGRFPFLSAETQDPRMDLIWFGHAPWR